MGHYSADDMGLLRHTPCAAERLAALPVRVNAQALLRTWALETRNTAAKLGTAPSETLRRGHLTQRICALSVVLDAIDPGMGLMALDALYPGVFAPVLAERQHVRSEPQLDAAAAQRLQAAGLVGGV